MIKGDEKIVMYESDEAAHKETREVEGWVSRDGYFYAGYNAECQARYRGSTHRICPVCGEVYETNGYCNHCAQVREDEKFAAMPAEKWDETKDMVCIYDDGETFFGSRSEIDEWCEDQECKPEELKLEICKPDIAKPVDFESYYEDELPEGRDLPDEFAEQCEKLNNWIKEHKPVLSYRGCEIRAIL
jgi:hypothetical protein